MQWPQGTIATFTADFISGGGAPLPTTNPLVSIYDPDNNVVVENEVPDLLSEGSYSFSWEIPVDQEPVGVGWSTRWSAVHGSITLTGHEDWELAELGVVTVNNAVIFLRSRVGDRLLTGMVESDQFFTDAELHTLWVKNQMNMEMATIEGWFIKMAQYAELVDRLEGGSERRMSQKFRNAKTIYDTLVKSLTDSSSARLRALRVVGKPMNLRNDFHDPLGIFVTGLYGWSGDVDYVRTYPLKRFPMILG